MYDSKLTAAIDDPVIIFNSSHGFAPRDGPGLAEDAFRLPSLPASQAGAGGSMAGAMEGRGGEVDNTTLFGASLRRSMMIRP